MTEWEKKQFLQNRIQNMKLVIDDAGNVSVELKK